MRPYFNGALLNGVDECGAEIHLVLFSGLPTLPGLRGSYKPTPGRDRKDPPLHSFYSDYCFVKFRLDYVVDEKTSKLLKKCFCLSFYENPQAYFLPSFIYIKHFKKQQFGGLFWSLSLKKL